MAPAIPHRSLVGIEPCGAGNLVPGEVVAFDEGGRVVLSRLAEAGTGRTLRCRDDNDRSSHLVPASALRGRAIWRSSQGSLLRLDGVKTGPPVRPEQFAPIVRGTGHGRGNRLGAREFPGAFWGGHPPRTPSRQRGAAGIAASTWRSTTGSMGCSFLAGQAVPAAGGTRIQPGVRFLKRLRARCRGGGQESLETLRLVGEHLGRAGIPWLVAQGPVLAARSCDGTL